MLSDAEDPVGVGVRSERMSANELAVYTRHLQENKQETERFKIAFWKKLFDPLAIFVLMALALPFGTCTRAAVASA
jgi:lipopolysaccharide export system permease protein